jgi:hypothetical protein
MATPTTISAIFDNNPEATVVVTELGHAHGRARHSGKCRLTGAVIQAGQPARTVKGVCRSGRAFKTYTPSSGRDRLGRGGVFHTLRHGWSREFQIDGGQRTVRAYAWKKTSSGWVDAVASKVETAKPGALVLLASPDMDGCMSVAQYTLRSDGRWLKAGGSYSGVSMKQMMSSIRRSKRYTMWQVFAPTR